MDVPFLKLSQHQRLLVTGVDGMLGANLALSLADRFIVEGFFLRAPVRGERAYQAHQACRLAEAVHQQLPAWIIHCGVLARSNWDPPIGPVSGAAESRLVARLARAASEVGARLTVLSTDAVFCGPRLFHGPADPTSGHRAWSRAARQIERTADDGRTLVVRTHPFGWSPTEPDQGFAARLETALRSGAPFALDPEQHATPILATDLAELLWAAYRQGLHGVQHLAGAERVGIVPFARRLAEILGVEHAELTVPPQAASRSRIQQGETALDTRQSQALLGQPMPRFQEGLERLVAQALGGYRTRLRRLSVVIPARAA